MSKYSNFVFKTNNYPIKFKNHFHNILANNSFNSTITTPTNETIQHVVNINEESIHFVIIKTLKDNGKSEVGDDYNCIYIVDHSVPLSLGDIENMRYDNSTNSFNLPFLNCLPSNGVHSFSFKSTIDLLESPILEIIEIN
ncbi:hypothetical protein DFA_04753 [Cavenderia fasciculata]|uniref:Uncharacterized protein n=1 Tax=Cavenderia fasciculata TaxID=261658 RepID=F4PQG0_CACFS|nr:uncharacterized protein DFA_04753 [Cavenderia fasciculata]EGG22623.1 hypothetical protein DFA_04753 [Cavenderia fasciculata]|eukprot:XP_004360474.1 hypothetical protein DFA_04753 [Cavenderia fasciculata]